MGVVAQCGEEAGEGVASVCCVSRMEEGDELVDAVFAALEPDATEEGQDT